MGNRAVSYVIRVSYAGFVDRLTAADAKFIIFVTFIINYSAGIPPQHPPGCVLIPLLLIYGV